MNTDKEKTGKKGIPIENEHVSNNPNRTPKGDDRDKKVNPHEHKGYVEPYNKKKFQSDPKSNKSRKLR